MILLDRSGEKRINSIVSELNELFNSLNIKTPYFIAGGAVFSALVNNKKFRDIDIYFYSEKDAESAIYTLECECIKRAKESPFSNFGVFKSDLAASFSGFLKCSTKDIQLIRCNSGTPEEVFKNFDLIQSMCAITPEEKIIKDPRWSKFLEVNPEKINAETLKRVLKYTNEKGAESSEDIWKVCDFLIQNLESDLLGGYNGKTTTGKESILQYRECHQYVHDYIHREYPGEEQIEMFETLNYDDRFIVENRSTEMLVALRDETNYELDGVIGLVSTQVIPKEALEKYPEFYV